MYDKQRCAGQAMPCEAEFRAYHLLTLIGTHGRYRYDATEYQGALAVSTDAPWRGLCPAISASEVLVLPCSLKVSATAHHNSALDEYMPREGSVDDKLNIQEDCFHEVAGLCMYAGSVSGGPVLGRCAASGLDAAAFGGRQLGSLPAPGHKCHLLAGLSCAHVLPGHPSKGLECYRGSR